MPTEPEKLDLVTEARELLAKATPGPWQVERNTKRLEVSPIRPDGQWVSMVAQVYKSGRCNGNNYRMPAEANAALIARAPELLRLLADECERLRKANKSMADELAHQDSYWDDPLRGFDKC